MCSLFIHTHMVSTICVWHSKFAARFLGCLFPSIGLNLKGDKLNTCRKPESIHGQRSQSPCFVRIFQPIHSSDPSDPQKDQHRNKEILQGDWRRPGFLTRIWGIWGRVLQQTMAPWFDEKRSQMGNHRKMMVSWWFNGDLMVI